MRRWLLLGLVLALGCTVTDVASGGANAARVPTGTDLGLRISSLNDDRVPAPSWRNGTYVARVLIATSVKARPAGKRAVWFARPEAKWSGSAQKLMVLRSAVVNGRTWLKVKLPIRPNVASGWISRDRVRLSRSPHYILVDRSRRLVRAYRNGKVVGRFKIVVGEPATPTPVGLFALYERVRQPDPKGFIGPWAVHLTAHSDVLKSYDGGPGRIAFHGRDGASLADRLGTARSHGCMRMNNRLISWIKEMSMGTAVRVVR